MIEVVPTTPEDPAFAAWHAAVAGAYRADREPSWWSSLDATRTYFAREPVRTRYLALAAMLDGEVVGGAELSLPLDDDTETIEVELGVLPEHRGRGVGAALADEVTRVALAHGRTTLQGELMLPAATVWAQWPGARMAERLGLRSVSQEDRFLLDLPVDVDRLAVVEASLPDPGGDRVVSFVGACPDEHLVELARLRTQMNQDVPMGELTRTPRTIDTERIRESERTMAEQGWTKVRSIALDPDGRGLGYTELLVSAHEPDFVLQDDTLVDRAARGRRLGARLKAANLRRLLADARLTAGRRWVQTYTEQDNVAMQRTNERFGFRRVDVLHECEGTLTG